MALPDNIPIADNAPAKPNREQAVDVLRGVVMVIMALDHVREFLHAAPFDSVDLAQADAALFLTRWISHFCAPVFVFFAGLGAFLQTTRGKAVPQVARRLLTRGLWLILLEFTLVHFGWFFFCYDVLIAQVIWAIGCSMIALAGLVFLPTPVIVAAGVTLIAGQHLFDAVVAHDLGSFDWLWVIFVSGGILVGVDPARPLIPFDVIYPILPWLGIMLVGYGFGQLWQLDRDRRRRYVFGLGIGLTLLFVALRALNLYGNKIPWSEQSSSLFTLLSFINCEKYPPSLLFVLMTLGPALCALAYADRLPQIIARPLATFGRVPLFFYLLHLPLIHVIAVGLAYVQFGNFGEQFQAVAFAGPGSFPPHEGYNLPVIYLVWLIVILLLYPVCRRFAEVKRQARDGWRSYF